MRTLVYIFLLLPFIGYFSIVQAASDSTQINLYVEGCNNNGICEGGLGETVNSCPVDCPAPSSSGGSGGGGGYSPTTYTFNDLSVVVGTSTALVHWTTSVATISKLSWGSNSDGSAGTISEASMRGTHDIVLTALQPNTQYVISIRSLSAQGIANYTMYTFRTLPIDDTIAPANITNFFAYTSFGANVGLSWTNPVDADFDSVKITRSEKRFPKDPDEGLIVYEGREQSALDLRTLPNTNYYYAGFAKDFSGNFSSGSFTFYKVNSGTIPTDNTSTGSGKNGTATVPTGGQIGSGKSTSPNSGVPGQKASTTLLGLANDTVEKVWKWSYFLLLFIIVFILVRAFFRRFKTQ